MLKPFPATQVGDLTRWDRLRLAWRDLRFAQSHGVFSVVPPGHFYSPIPSLDDLSSQPPAASDDDPPGIDLRPDAQLALARELALYAREAPFGPEPTEGLRYHLANPFFYEADGLVYHCLLRHWRPRRVVEVGSGYSSAVLLDTRDRDPGIAAEVTCIDPYPERLRTLLRPGDDVQVLAAPVQEVDPAVFDALEPGDLLFIDSSHVSKAGSDVNRLLLEVLPRLPAGVHVHIHDIFFPFEYPPEFLFGGMAWNEAYLVRALLVGSSAFAVTWWNSYLAARHLAEVEAVLPGWRPGSCSSLWLVAGEGSA